MSKKLIVCADGTWNTDNGKDQGHGKVTNVAKIARALLPTDRQGTTQLVHYERGVGTDVGARLSGGGLGRGLFQNVMDTYRFLINNYEPPIDSESQGDRIYLFGFSRGAYTVRSLAGLIRNSGILKRGHEAFEDEAVDLYRDYDPDTAPDGTKSVQFRSEHSHDVDVEFIGVFDTVGALGIPGLDGRFRLLKGLDWQFHDVTLSSRVNHAFHALAIHEHRTDFVPTLWEQKTSSVGRQTFEQVWFSGAHSDVGGGYEEAGLSDVALEWMVHRAKKYGNLDFGDTVLNMHPDANGPGHDSFGTFYKVLDWFRGNGDGTLRQFRINPNAPTAEALHESVRQRYLAKPHERWPASFLQELQKEG